MSNTTRRQLITAASALPFALHAPTAWSQGAGGAYPNKPIRVIVSFPPGGAADQIARAVSQPLQEALGQPVVVENRAGANGNIAGEYVAKQQPADGYTLLMSSGGTVAINPHLYPKMPFDPAKDLVPVAAGARVLVFLVTNPQKVPANNVREFLAYLKANPGKVTFGSPGNGSSPHLAAEMMKSTANVFATHIPYRGAAPALQDLLGGQIDFMFDPGIGLQHVKAGRLKLLAVGSPRRSPQWPDTPTMEESGLRGFDADTWFGFYAASGTPQPVVTRLNTEINRILRTPAFVERMNALGAIPAPMSPQDFGARAQIDSVRYGALIRARNIKGD
ncbi:MAG TPA: tripartite tricarboxylate transporter substrate binding protein [Ramlibacter sp.]|nr:tripartite tricarboxylate transporter substrate binding protein [Ramlibacter sp.]